MSQWTMHEFETHIYNPEYINVDPEYVRVRPESNAKNLVTMFGDRPTLRHLDYGGGGGLLSRTLADRGWNSASYDPFVDENVRVNQLGQFDLITAYEVFEHVPNVDELMDNLEILLSPNGLVLFSTLVSDGNIQPNRRITWWYASPRNGHISLFSRNSLAVLARQRAWNFGSFSDGFHVFFKQVPSWAQHLIKLG